MTDRFCPQCQAQVEDAGGFCLLGHRMSEAAPTGSLSDLRAEVDQAFEDARLQVNVMLQGTPPAPPAPDASMPGPATTVPALPVPVAVPQTTPAAYATIDRAQPQGPGDPINDFAPAPRMDWGPERQSLLKRRGSL